MQCLLNVREAAVKFLPYSEAFLCRVPVYIVYLGAYFHYVSYLGRFIQTLLSEFSGEPGALWFPAWPGTVKYLRQFSSSAEIQKTHLAITLPISQCWRPLHGPLPSEKVLQTEHWARLGGK